MSDMSFTSLYFTHLKNLISGHSYDIQEQVCKNTAIFQNVWIHKLAQIKCFKDTADSMELWKSVVII